MFSSQTSCQKGQGFTLIEMLVVICILGILGAALVTSVQSGYKQARQANCKSNLRQFGVALTIYRGEHDNLTPDWLSNLYPEYVDDRSMYVCRADLNNGGAAPVASAYLGKIKDTQNFYRNSPTWDNEKGSGTTRNRAVQRCSYCYEFSAAEGAGGWYNGDPLPESRKTFSTIAEYKRIQLDYGDNNNRISGTQMPYSGSRLPIIRCTHHWRDQYIYGRANSGSSSPSRQPITINVAYAGNVFAGPPWWEGTLHPGETTGTP
jgi:prepilin-type N-terminal cleavage/methylation domain-containing protein